MFPQSSFSLECQQWRHGEEAEAFSGEIHVAHDVTKVSGALECRIHAENLSEAASTLVPVRIAIKAVSVLERAAALIAALEPRFLLSKSS